MKKKNFLLYSLLLLTLIGGLLFSIREAEHTQVKVEPENITQSQGNKVEAKQTQLELQAEQSTKELKKQPEEQALSACDLFELQKPAMNSRWEDFVAEHYMSIEDLSPRGGAYTSLDIASLKSLANANDTNAMLVYGSATFWQAAAGVDIFEIGLEHNNKSKEAVTAHEIDLEAIKVAEDYMFRAAVLGRTGSIMEMQGLQNLLFRRYIKITPPHEKARLVLVKDLALTEFFKKVHANDKVLMRGYDDYDIADGFKAKISTWLGTDDQERIDKEYAFLAQDSEKYYADLISQWTQQRDYYGIEHFPKLLDKELSAYLELQNQCDSEQ